MVMIVVGIIAVGCAFIFVTRIHSSKDFYDITTSADASPPEASSDGSEKDEKSGDKPDREEVGKKEKTKSKNKDKGNDSKKDNNDSEQSTNMLDKILVPLDSIVVNIGKVDSKRYLRVIISLEVKNSEIEAKVKANKVVFRDKLVTFLSSKNISDISTQASHIGLRAEIKEILNSDLLGSDDAISQVYFSDFIIQ